MSWPNWLVALDNFGIRHARAIIMVAVVVYAIEGALIYFGTW